jgi:hypothetical protein
MLAHGFTIAQMVELVREALATAQNERVVAGGRTSRSRGCGLRRQGVRP